MPLPIHYPLRYNSRVNDHLSFSAMNTMLIKNGAKSHFRGTVLIWKGLSSYKPLIEHTLVVSSCVLKCRYVTDETKPNFESDE